MKKNSEIFCSEDANNYFERNKNKRHSCFIDYLLEIFPRSELSGFDIAEFGIGNGQNLMYLKHFANKVHGYEASEKACEMFKRQYSGHPCEKDFCVSKVNVAKPFTGKSKYDMVIYGFFPYYCNDAEMKVCKRNTLRMLKDKAYIYVFDFLVRKNVSKADSRNKNLFVYKRNLQYWTRFLHDFDLIDMRLFDCGSEMAYKEADSLRKIDCNLTANDADWLFSGLFRRK